MSEPETGTGKYMYCIISGGQPREFTSPGLGERGDVVHTVSFTDLAAVVSDSPLVDYDRSRRNLMAHTLVLEEVMQAFTILPVRFGAVAPSAEAIQAQVLSRRYDELTGLLAEMEGRVELGLKAIWREEGILREIVETGPPALHRLRDKIKGRPVEETYYDRLSLGEMIEVAMGKKREEDAEKLLARLIPLADEHKLNPLFSDQMVLNAAFLVNRDRQGEFDAAVRQLDDEMGDRLILKYVGPVPPYNFVSIVIAWDQ